ncbi:MAG: hypothetical protein AAF441_04610 [Pseudomonadota bacterium]
MTCAAYLAGKKPGILVVILAAALAGCSKENSVTNFLSSTADQINSIDTRIQGSSSTANACNPAGHIPSLSDPATRLSGRTFKYLRGERAKGLISYNANGTFAWRNEKATKNGTGTWFVKGSELCEAFDAGPHNEAVSPRCWVVTEFRGALCFGLTRLSTPEGGPTAKTLY